MLRFALLGLVVVLLGQVVILAHELGHARAALRSGAGDTYIDLGRPVLVRLPRVISTVLGVPETDLYWGPWPSGFCGHQPVVGRTRLLALYRAGYRATLRLALIALGAAMVAFLVVPGPPAFWLRLLGSGLAVVAFIDAAASKFIETSPLRDRRHGHGSDPYHLRRLARDPSFEPPPLQTAASVRADRRGRVLGL